MSSSEDDLQELWLLFYQEGPGDQIQVIRLGWGIRCLSPLSHLNGPALCLCQVSRFRKGLLLMHTAV